MRLVTMFPMSPGDHLLSMQLSPRGVGRKLLLTTSCWSTGGRIPVTFVGRDVRTHGATATLPVGTWIRKSSARQVRLLTKLTFLKRTGPGRALHSDVISNRAGKSSDTN